jgi:hypothetical protein
MQAIDPKSFRERDQPIGKRCAGMNTNKYGDNMISHATPVPIARLPPIFARSEIASPWPNPKEFGKRSGVSDAVQRSNLLQKNRGQKCAPQSDE